MEAANLNYILVETFENNFRAITAASEIWVQNDELRWPPKGVVSKRKKHAVPENDWARITNFKVLGAPYKSLKDALAKEKTYENFSNTESEKEFMRKKESRRKHPVLALNDDDFIDENELFDEIDNKNREAEETQCIEDIPVITIPADLLNGSYVVDGANSSAIGDMISNKLSQLTSSAPSTHTSNNMNIGFNNAPSNSTAWSQLPAQMNAKSIENQIPAQMSIVTMGRSEPNIGQESVSYVVQGVQGPFPAKAQHPSSTVVSNQFYSQSSEPQQQFSLQPMQLHMVPNFNFNYNATEGNQNVSSEQNTGRTIGINPFSDSTNINHISKMKQGPRTSTKTIKNNKASAICKKKSTGKGKGKENVNGKTESKIKRKTKTIGNDVTKSVNNLKKSGKLVKSKGQQQSKLLKNYQQTSQEPSSNSTQGGPFGGSTQLDSLGGSRRFIARFHFRRLIGWKFINWRYINNFVPSPPHSVEENYIQKKYLPLIYKEILDFKNTYTADRFETNRKIDTIDKNVDNIGMKVNKIEQMGGNIDSSRSEVENLFADDSIFTFDSVFPKTKKREVKQLEVDLKSDPIYQAKLEFRLKSLSCQKPRTMVRTFMRYIVCDSLLQKYSWKGRNKLAFYKLKTLCNSILLCVQTRHKKYTKSKFDTYMGNYIKLAKSRWERKEDQRKRNEGNEEENEEEDEEDDEDGDGEVEDEDDEEEGTEEDTSASDDDDDDD